MLIPLLQSQVGVLITREQTLESPGVRGGWKSRHPCGRQVSDQACLRLVSTPGAWVLWEALVET